VCAGFWCKIRDVTSGSLRQASAQEDERWGVAKWQNPGKKTSKTTVPL
jgi:hypothetical protein